MTLPEAIARLEALEKAAMPPKWGGLSHYIEFSLCHDGDDEMQQTKDNRAMLLAARNALPSLLACVKALKATPCKCRNLSLSEIPGSLLNDGVTSVAVTCSKCASLAQFLAAVGGEESHEA